MGVLNTVLRLVNRGVDINQRDKVFGTTPLHWSRVSGETKALIAAGADINVKSHHGRTPLHLAMTYRCAEALIAAGADINAKDSDGETPLMYALRFGYTGMALALIDAGADLTVPDKYGQTPVGMAVSRGRAQVLEAMLKAGADPDLRDGDGRTALWWAEKSPVIVDILQKAGADMESCNNVERVIKNLRGEVIYRHVCDKNDMRKTVGMAVSEGVILEGADLRGAFLWKVVLDSAKLRGASFKGSKLNGACMRNADLRDTDFRTADLSAVRFFGSDMSGSDMRDALIGGQNFRGVLLKGAKLSGVDVGLCGFDGWTRYSIGDKASRVAFFENHLIIEDECYTIDEWEGFGKIKAEDWKELNNRIVWPWRRFGSSVADEWGRFNKSDGLWGFHREAVDNDRLWQHDRKEVLAWAEKLSKDGRKS